ncbi:outer dense fiber protein 3-like protein 2 [Achroia grisella]|uniref:outer dense fiber protein 3-like protein 2 n=1 Tax=Achroia grisella TaxID=688607 RepID=UPI0027D2F5BF|nr:outer dense fiber protein 3-like protein 2 [Achroia grisella]
MSWGWECRAKFVKQLPAKPTERRGLISGERGCPGPNRYEAPQIFCGNGYSKIRRSPAYTFGHRTRSSFSKPVTTPFAPMFGCQGLGSKGQYRITHCVITPHIESPYDRVKIPGPGTYAPTAVSQYKRPPSYSMRPAARPPYQAWDQWTPPPNMYYPPIPAIKAPAYTLGYMERGLKAQNFPGPGEHEPNFDYVKKNKPAFSFGSPFKSLRPPKTPPPNAYCEKKFMVTKRTMPTPSFGIRHTPYLGRHEVPLKSSKLGLIINGAH